MKYRSLLAALAAVCAVTVFAHNSSADPNRNGGDGGGRTGGDWIVNGPDLLGVERSGNSSLSIGEIVLPGAK